MFSVNVGMNSQPSPSHLFLVNESSKDFADFIRLVNEKGKYVDVALQDINGKHRFIWLRCWEQQKL
jgi:hypothetical protein